MGGDIRPPAKLIDVRPVYPVAAKDAGIQGVVIIEATVGKDGKVKYARVLRSIPELDQAALDAVNQWEFSPTAVNGELKNVIMTVTVNFTLM
jgi:protein TonB